MGFESTGDMKTMEFCGATRPSEKLPSQRVERVTCFATEAEISSRKNLRTPRIQTSDLPRKKCYDRSPNDRTVSTASYRSPAFTCRRMRCMWFLTVCSERCKAREASAMDVLAAVCAVARGEAVCPNAVERKAMRLT